MNVTTRPRMTLDEFLAWEEQQEGRFEFNGFGPEEMTGGTDRHSAIKTALYFLLYGLLQDSAWMLFDSDMKVQVAGRIRYPDAFIGPALIDGSTLRRDPVVIFEVLSDSTARNDRHVKNAEYAATQSVRRYVMLEQDTVAATIFERVDGEWTSHPLTGRDAILHIPEIGVSIPMRALYRRALPAEG